MVPFRVNSRAVAIFGVPALFNQRQPGWLLAEGEQRIGGMTAAEYRGAPVRRASMTEVTVIVRWTSAVYRTDQTFLLEKSPFFTSFPIPLRVQSALRSVIRASRPSRDRRFPASSPLRRFPRTLPASRQVLFQLKSAWIQGAASRIPVQ
jgi:hypothetical protein